MTKTHNGAITLALVPSLHALLTTASVTRAAELTGISQPAMSRILSRLRRELNDPLLVRTGTRWTLTPRAEQLQEPACALLAQARALGQSLTFDPTTSDRTFVMTVPDVVGASLLPKLWAAFASYAPSCRLILRPWPGPIGDLASLDAAIACEPDFFPNFRMEPLFEDYDVVAFRKDDGPPHSAEYLSRAHVAVVPAGFKRDIVDDWLEKQGLARRICVSVPHYLQAMNLVAQTSLLAILPSRLVADEKRVSAIGTVKLELPQEADRYWLFYPPRLEADAGSKWLRELLHRICFSKD